MVGRGYGVLLTPDIADGVKAAIILAPDEPDGDGAVRRGVWDDPLDRVGLAGGDFLVEARLRDGVEVVIGFQGQHGGGEGQEGRDAGDEMHAEGLDGTVDVLRACLDWRAEIWEVY